MNKNEYLLKKELTRQFKDLEKEILESLEKYYNDGMYLLQVSLILQPVLEALDDYTRLLFEYNLKEYHKTLDTRVEKSRKPFVDIGKEDDFFGTLDNAEQELYKFVTAGAYKTITNLNNQIFEILIDGYKSGKGINYVASMLQERFSSLATWEAKRIARTEILGAHNYANYINTGERGAEYLIWITARDDRVRDTELVSHVKLDGEIIPYGGTFSNDLHYAGDRSGDIQEWIYCRCKTVSYVIPPGFMAPPGMERFTEADLIEIAT